MFDMDVFMDKILDEIEHDRKFEFISKFDDLNPLEFLPRRSTENSAGYDFICISEQVVPAHQIAYIKTGVKIKLPKDEFLMLCNRSSNPKKRGLILINGVGIVDSDYYNNDDNEGEIMFAFYNIKDDDVTLHVGDKLGQGIIFNYKHVSPDFVESNIRSGGFGSTGN